MRLMLLILVFGSFQVHAQTSQGDQLQTETEKIPRVQSGIFGDSFNSSVNEAIDQANEKLEAEKPQ